MRERESAAAVSHAAGPARLNSTLGLWNLVIIAMVVIQPTAPMGIYGVISNKAHGHVVTTILFAMIAMLFTAISYGRRRVCIPVRARRTRMGGRRFTPPSVTWLGGAW